MQINETKNQMDDFRNATINLTIIVFSTLFAGIVSLFAFIVWDRRTAVSKVSEEQTQIMIILRTQQDKITIYDRIFKDVANGKSLSSELLHQYGI